MPRRIQSFGRPFRNSVTSPRKDFSNPLNLHPSSITLASRTTTPIHHSPDGEADAGGINCRPTYPYGAENSPRTLAGVLAAVPALSPYATPISFTVVVAGITYLSLAIGELVPKRLALNDPEAVASRMAGPMRTLSVVASPAVRLLAASTEATLKMLGARRSEEPPVTEGEVEVLLEEGARAGVFEEAERDLVERAPRLDDRPVRELMTPRPKIIWLDAADPPEEHRRVVAQSRHSYYPVALGDLDELSGLASTKEAGARVLGGEPADLLGTLRRPPLVSEGAPATEWHSKLSSVSACRWRSWSTSAAT